MAGIEGGIAPGGLRARILEQSRRALAAGALQPIVTRLETLPGGAMDFVVRVLAGRTGKPGPAAGATDPFMPPYDPDLYVGDLSATHVGLLNKYSVLDEHLLIVTRAFEDQRELLTPGDFAALWRCLAEIDGLGFYNGGREAGASQSHKHLQVVPRRAAGRDGLPVEALAERALNGAGIATIPALSFCHALARVDATWLEDPARGGKEAATLYRRVLMEAGLAPGERWQAAPYNLLVTRRWMLAVARSRENYGNISVNSLGYAGALLVADEERLEELRRAGPMQVLEAVSRPRA